MEQFTYQVPSKVRISTKIPIITEHSGTVFTIQKQPHRFIASIFNSSLRFGLPYCYKIANACGQPLYSIDCAFPGIRYIITDHSSSQTVPITIHRVQLIEKAYSFTLTNNEYYFEKDYTNSGHLKLANRKIASVSMPSEINISSNIDTVIINSTTQEISALAAVLYHTFYYYGA